mmetsp:Transcript_38604/g.85918  ORF Transcript_38604/g.85918 Transcript_38604/m.85918 type:complete len:162 (+) Transcript_38604:278-763(+)
MSHYIWAGSYCHMCVACTLIQDQAPSTHSTAHSTLFKGTSTQGQRLMPCSSHLARHLAAALLALPYCAASRVQQQGLPEHLLALGPPLFPSQQALVRDPAPGRPPWAPALAAAPLAQLALAPQAAPRPPQALQPLLAPAAALPHRARCLQAAALAPHWAGG